MNGMAPGDALLEVRGLRKRWPDGRVVLDGIDLALARGEVTALLGPNGCGKSTLLRCLNRLEEHEEGRIWLAGELVSEGRPPGRRPGRAEQLALARLRRRIGLVFQQLELFPHLDVLGNVMLGPQHVLRRPRAEARRLALAALRRVGLEERAGAAPAALSGGQQQRVAIARALVMGPELLLFDEPTSALDPLLVRGLIEVIRDLARDGIGLLVVTHDLQVARAVADRVLFMDAGRIVFAGTPDEAFGGQHPALRRFTII